MEESDSVLAWLAATPFSHAMRYSLWLYPIVEIVHIIGFVLLVGSVAMFDFRVLGASRSIPVQTLGRHLLRRSIAGLFIIVPAGLMLFSAHPHEFIENPVFLTKLTLIATAGLNALLFHVGIYRSVEAWNLHVPAPAQAKLHALVSLALWLSVITCGRLLAYT